MSTPATILVVFGTRPEAIKLFPVVAALQADPRFDARVCVSAQHRGMLDQVLEIAGIVPDHDLDVMKPDQSLDALTATLLTGLGAVMDAVKPARVIVQGDTATAMAGALAAYYRKVPVDHVEAGLRSHNIYHPWPEEVNRKIIGAIASLHFAPTETSAQALRRENVDPARVHVTGNTVIDALVATAAPPAPGFDAEVSAALQRPGPSVLVTVHRRESWGVPMQAIARAIKAVCDDLPDTTFIFPIHLNPVVRETFKGILGGNSQVVFVEPLPYRPFVHLMKAADLVITDSGGIQEEAPTLGKPVLVMRDTTERPEGIAAGTARLVGTDTAAIHGALSSLLTDQAAYDTMATATNPYGDGRAATRIADHLEHHFGLRSLPAEPFTL